MRKFAINFLTFLIGSVFLLGSVSFLWAQESVESATDEFTLEEVIVTAEKREENLQAVPRSLAVITADELDLRSAGQVQDIIANTAGISFAAGGAWLNHIGMRGVMPNTAEIGSEPAVQFNIDGNVALSYEGSIAPMYAAMNDVERIEVIRGPSGAVNGRMAAAGSINVVTKDPDFEKLDGYVGYTIGNYNTRNSKAAINLPLKLTGLDLPSYLENLAVRFAIRQDKHSEYIHNSEGEGVSGNLDFFTWRGKLKWQPTDNVDVLAHLSYSRDKSNTEMGVPSIEVDQIWPPAEAHPDDPWLNATGTYETPTKEEQWSESLTVNWATKFGTVTGRYGKTWIPWDCSERDTTGVCYDGEIYQQEYEIRMASPDDSRIRWMVGAYKFHKKEYSGPDEAVGTIDPDSVTISFSDWYGSDSNFEAAGYDINDSAFDANNLDRPWALSYIAPVTSDSIVFVQEAASRPIDSYSYFGNITLPFLEDRHRFTIGLRKNIEEKKRQLIIAVYGADEDNTNGGLPHFTYDSEEEQWVCDNCYEIDEEPSDTWTTDDEPVNYTIGYEYDWKEDVMLYANVNNGYKPGGITPNATPASFYEPEEMINYAIGTRSRWFNNKVQLNVEVYLMKFKNYQQNMASEGSITYTMNGTEYTQAIKASSRTMNFGSTNIWGIELDYDWLITNKDRLKGNAEFRHAKYGALAFYRGQNANPPGSADYVSFEGRQMPFSPKYSLYASYSHRFMFGNMMVTPQIDGRWVSKSFLSSEYWWEVSQPEIWQPSYYKFDAFLNIGPDTGKWQINAYVKNATEEVIRNLGVFRVNIEAPRTYGIGLTVNF